MHPREFAERILTLRLRFAFSVTSWGRTPAHNQAVGGQPNSRHLTWRGVDVLLDDPGQREEFFKCAVELGLKALDERDHIHIQTP